MPLQVEEDPRFSRVERRLSLVGFVLMGLLIAAAVLGLLGDGPLSQATAQDGRLRVEYPRFARQQAEAALSVWLGPDVYDDSVELVIARSLLDPEVLDRIWPEPDDSVIGVDEVMLRYRHAPGLVALQLRPQVAGLMSGEISVLGDQVGITTIVYP